MSKPITTAIIGAGFIGSLHARNLAQHAQIELKYVVDANEKVGSSIASQNGAEWVANPESVFADDSIEAIFIATPPASHAALLRAGREASKAIFCEKPISSDLDEANTLVFQFEGYEKPVFIGFNRRFDQSHSKLKSLIDDGTVGNIEHISITSRDPSPPPVEYMRGTPGGIFYDTMIHDFDVARWLLGEEPTELYSTASVHLGPDLNPDRDFDAATTTLKTASGAVCQISASRRATYGYDQRIEVFGSKGMLTSTNHTQTQVVFADEHGYRTDPLEHFFTDRYANAYLAEIDTFVAACRGEPAEYPRVIDGAAALRLSLEALKSAREEKTIKL